MLFRATKTTATVTSTSMLLIRAFFTKLLLNTRRLHLISQPASSGSPASFIGTPPVSNTHVRTIRTLPPQIPNHKKKLREKLKALGENGAPSGPRENRVKILVPVPKSTLSTATYPYFVSRTAALNLPVYTDYKKGGTQPITLVRKVEGDVQLFHNELSKALDKESGQAVSMQLNHNTNIITIRGIHALFVKKWLTEKGF